MMIMTTTKVIVMEMTKIKKLMRKMAIAKEKAMVNSVLMRNTHLRQQKRSESIRTRTSFEKATHLLRKSDAPPSKKRSKIFEYRSLCNSRIEHCNNNLAFRILS